MSKKFALMILSILTIGTFFTNSVSAATLLVEDFNAAAGTAITAANWTAHSGAGTNPLVTSEPGLTLAGYPSSGVGNAVSMTTSGEDANRPFAVQSSGSVYAAFMVTVSEASVDPAGGYFFHLGPDPVGTTFRGRVFAKKDASNNIAFGISKAATAAVDIVYTPFTYSLNTTYLIVVKYTIVDGATNDTVSLFVSTDVPATEPAATISASDVGATDVNPGTVAIRQGAVATSPTARVDGIRVGTDWASVTQAVAAADAPVDFDGDGKTDWVVVRNTGGGTSGQLTWFWNLNGSANPTAASAWGLNSDFLTPADFDGDQKDDIAVWRDAPALTAAFYILNSATSTARVEPFGQTGDNPSVVNDYNGDGKDDLAVWRSSNGTWYYRTTAGGAVTFVSWGAAGDFVAPGDYNGDGTADFGIQRTNGAAGDFWILLSTGVVQPVVSFGLSTDFVITADFDGDAKTDIATFRGSNSTWYWRPSSGGADQQVPFGVNTDIPAPGDYNGDGRTDIAHFRDGVFYVYSPTGGTITFFTLGAAGDRVPAFYNVH